MFGPIAVLLPVLLVSFLIYLHRRSKVTNIDIAWFSSGSAASAQEEAVYHRYLLRHRRHRILGGAFGAVFATLVGIRLYQRITIGIVEDGLPFADIWFCTLAGILIGAFSAELFRLNEPPSDTIVASLAERGVEPRLRFILAARALAVAALVVAAAIAAVSNSFDALGVAVIGGMLAAVAERTRQAVTHRRRPLLSESAKAVDITIRTFATDSVTLLQGSAALLVAAWVTSKLPETDRAAISLTQFLLVMGFLVASVVALRKARPYPPRGWANRRVAA